MTAMPSLADFNASWSNRNGGEVLVTGGSVRTILSAATAQAIVDKLSRALSVPVKAAETASGRPSSTLDLLSDWIGRSCDTSDAGARGPTSELYESFREYCAALDMGSMVSLNEFGRQLELLRFYGARLGPKGLRVRMGIRLKESLPEPERVADAAPAISEPLDQRKWWLGSQFPFRAKRLQAVQTAIGAAEAEMADIVNVGSILFTMDEAKTIECGLRVDTDGPY